MILARQFAPVCYFVYARPAHTRATLAALARCEHAKDTELLVFADAPRSSAEARTVEQVRAIVRAADGFRSVEVIERAANFGLAQSIIEGVSEACRRYGAAIVVEDDVLVSPHFLRYMNDGLRLYADDNRVCSIGGYMFPVREPLPDQFFLGITDTWGWATWERAWSSFEADGAKLLSELQTRGLEFRFNMGGAYDYIAMLRDQVARRNDSWGVRWYATNLLLGRLTLYPGTSMTNNVGNEGSGRHRGHTDVFSVRPSGDPINLRRIPVEESAEARRIVSAFLRSCQPTLLKRAVANLRHWARQC